MYATIDDARVAPSLSGVPETMLLTTWTRSAYSSGPDNLLHDPLLNELVRQIDYDFRGRFGAPSPVHAIRSRYADERIRTFLTQHPDGTVVVLGEGLETQFWRVNEARVPWYSVDLPESIAIRRRLLPADPQNRLVECSALDTAWLDQIATESSGPVFVSTAGLLMYFTEDQVVTLLRNITERLPRGEVFFDTIPPWFSRKTLRGWHLSRQYTAPPMPFGLALADLPELIERVPRLEVVAAPNYSQPYPRYMRLFNLLSRIPYVHNHIAPGLIHCRFGA
ncbi:class I SAM-dependent methyltransferase [Pseudomonas matsuisoli]|uniref:O-methyltransferase OMT n=1 Tax=Pseudomonas matsuisoli TaxID=1515666 RepID=A0A917PPF9_9PSED|nr:class I SAM-dependent methyltransferase [Pseudomonas matsuisoli]GGJ86989.1 putative O-methyltransferase OMT [Pseudomonas matsuisoli]